MLGKAHRVSQPLDRWAVERSILGSITFEEHSRRVRDIRHGENVKSIWDVLASDTATFVWRTPEGEMTHEMPKHLVYTEADALEDAILFPDDDNQTLDSQRVKSIENDVTKFESGRLESIMFARFVEDLDTDEELSPEAAKKFIKNTGLKKKRRGQLLKETEKKGSTHEADDDSSSWEDESESDQEMESPSSSTVSGPKVDVNGKAVPDRHHGRRSVIPCSVLCCMKALSIAILERQFSIEIARLILT